MVLTAILIGLLVFALIYEEILLINYIFLVYHKVNYALKEGGRVEATPTGPLIMAGVISILFIILVLII